MRCCEIICFTLLLFTPTILSLCNLPSELLVAKRVDYFDMYNTIEEGYIAIFLCPQSNQFFQPMSNFYPKVFSLSLKCYRGELIYEGGPYDPSNSLRCVSCHPLPTIPHASYTNSQCEAGMDTKQTRCTFICDHDYTPTPNAKLFVKNNTSIYYIECFEGSWGPFELCTPFDEYYCNSTTPETPEFTVIQTSSTSIIFECPSDYFFAPEIITQINSSSGQDIRFGKSLCTENEIFCVSECPNPPPSSDPLVIYLEQSCKNGAPLTAKCTFICAPYYIPLLNSYSVAIPDDNYGDHHYGLIGSIKCVNSVWETPRCIRRMCPDLQIDAGTVNFNEACYPLTSSVAPNTLCTMSCKRGQFEFPATNINLLCHISGEWIVPTDIQESDQIYKNLFAGVFHCQQPCQELTLISAESGAIQYGESCSAFNCRAHCKNGEFIGMRTDSLDLRCVDGNSSEPSKWVHNNGPLSQSDFDFATNGFSITCPSKCEIRRKGLEFSTDCTSGTQYKHLSKCTIQCSFGNFAGLSTNNYAAICFNGLWIGMENKTALKCQENAICASLPAIPENTFVGACTVDSGAGTIACEYHCEDSFVKLPSNDAKMVCESNTWQSFGCVISCDANLSSNLSTHAKIFHPTPNTQIVTCLYGNFERKSYDRVSIICELGLWVLSDRTIVDFDEYVCPFAPMCRYSPPEIKHGRITGCKLLKIDEEIVGALCLVMCDKNFVVEAETPIVQCLGEEGWVQYQESQCIFQCNLPPLDLDSVVNDNCTGVLSNGKNCTVSCKSKDFLLDNDLNSSYTFLCKDYTLLVIDSNSRLKEYDDIQTVTEKVECNVEKEKFCSPLKLRGLFRRNSCKRKSLFAVGEKCTVECIEGMALKNGNTKTELICREENWVVADFVDQDVKELICYSKKGGYIDEDGSGLGSRGDISLNFNMDKIKDLTRDVLKREKKNDYADLISVGVGGGENSSQQYVIVNE